MLILFPPNALYLLTNYLTKKEQSSTVLSRETYYTCQCIKYLSPSDSFSDLTIKQIIYLLQDSTKTLSLTLIKQLQCFHQFLVIFHFLRSG